MDSRAGILSVIASVSLLVPVATGREAFVYFGTFTNETSRGLYFSRLEAESGRLTAPELAAAIPSPGFLAVAPDGRFLFAVTRGDSNSGGVMMFARDPRTGQLALRAQAAAGGAGPCHISVAAEGRAVLIANYGGGSVKSFRVSPEGALTAGTFVPHAGRSVHPSRQTGPHAHCFVAAPGGRFALACDLGLDQVLIYRLDPSNATLTAHEPAFAPVPPGSGPRQLVFSPDGRSVYVLNELTCTVTAFGCRRAGSAPCGQRDPGRHALPGRGSRADRSRGTRGAGRDRARATGTHRHAPARREDPGGLPPARTAGLEPVAGGSGPGSGGHAIVVPAVARAPSATGAGDGRAAP